MRSPRKRGWQGSPELTARAHIRQARAHIRHKMRRFAPRAHTMRGSCLSAAHRIAYVVYNDVYRDSRVLKTADGAAAAGYCVRIYAFGGPVSHYPEGISHRRSGVEIVRLGVIPDRWPLARRALAGRRQRLAAARAQQATVAVAAPDVASADSVMPTAAALPRRSLQQQAIEIAMRVVIDARHRDFSRRAVSAIREWQPDLLHAHDANTLEVALRLQRSSGTPFVYDAHELWEERNAVRSDRVKRAEQLLLNRATERMQGSITVSPGIQNWMTERYGLRQPPTLVRNIPHAAPTPARQDGALRRMTGVSDDVRIITYVGAITTGRGIDEAIAVLPLLAANRHLVLLGQGSAENMAFFRALAARHGVAQRVHFAGSVESREVSTAIADSDVSLVYTQPKNLSYLYSLPNKLFESIRAGLPIVASDLPDVRSLVEEYELGELADPGDLDAMARAIEAVLTDADTYRRHAARAAAELNWENEMERLFALYDSVLKEDRTS